MREGKAERREVEAGYLRLSSVGQCVSAVCSSKNGSKSAKIREQSLDSNSILPLMFMLRSSSPIRLDVTVKLCQSDFPKNHPTSNELVRILVCSARQTQFPYFTGKARKRSSSRN